MKTLGALCALFTALFIPAIAAAQQPDAGATYLAPPEPLSIKMPVYPQEAIAAGEEAWVQLSFTIKADGTTADIAAVDGFYSAPFERASVAAATAWKFKPGTESGKAIDWRNYVINVPYVFVDVDAAVYPEFSSRYTEIAKLLNAKQFAAAKQKIEEAFAKRAVKLLYEYAVIEIALHAAENGLGHRRAAYEAIRRATPIMQVERREQQPELGSRINKRVQLSSTAILPDSSLKGALRDRFAAEANLGLYLDALDTYERLAKMEDIAATDPISKQAQLIRNALSSDQPLGISGRIEGGTWSTRPARRVFTFVDVKGTLEGIQVSCTGHVATLPFQPGIDWTMPGPWGDCDLELSGSDGTEFVFVQSGDAAPPRLEPPTPLTVSPPEGEFRLPGLPPTVPAPTPPGG